MDKQVLARTIWSTVEDLRGNIEAYTYKDYILGLLFYKFITDQEYDLLNKELGIEDEDIYQIREADRDIVDYCKDNLGYFVEPKNFYRKWIEDINNFTEDDLMTSLGFFERNIANSTKHVFGEIFDTINRNLTALAPSSNERTKILRKLMIAIKDIPTVNTEYDVLGYVYEYLISQFSAGAGKKSGEFFTPAEVSTVIARIVAHNLKDRKTVEVFDPTAGSATTQAVAHKMNRQYIGIEQMDYINTVSVPRLQKVIEGEQGGISKDVDWKGGGSFVYAELASLNERYVKDIQQASNEAELEKVLSTMKESAYLNFKVDLERVSSKDEGYAWEPYGAGASVGLCGLLGGLYIITLISRKKVANPLSLLLSLYIVVGLVSFASGRIYVSIGLFIMVGVLTGIIMKRKNPEKLLGTLSSIGGFIGVITLLVFHDIHGAAILGGSLTAVILFSLQRWS